MSKLQIKVTGGTTTSGHLCTGCKHSIIVAGHRLGERITQCSMIHGRKITFDVAECSQFYPKTQPWLSEYEEIAWMLVTKGGVRREVGFVRASDLTDKQRKEAKMDREPSMPDF